MVVRVYSCTATTLVYRRGRLSSRCHYSRVNGYHLRRKQRSLRGALHHVVVSRTARLLRCRWSKRFLSWLIVRWRTCLDRPKLPTEAHCLSSKLQTLCRIPTSILSRPICRPYMTRRCRHGASVIELDPNIRSPHPRWRNACPRGLWGCQRRLCMCISTILWVLCVCLLLLL